MVSLVIAVGLVLVPGVYAYVSSRRLVPRLDDPLLPDRLFARTQRIGTVIGLSVGVSLVTLGAESIWVLFGTPLAVLVGGFPARRTIFGESWGLFAYLSHTFRFWGAMLAPLVLIMLIPAAIGRIGMTAGLALGALAVLYWALGPRLFPAILGATPLARPELAPAFEAVLAKARCRRPKIYEADAPGGSFFNAFAVPSLGEPAVVFTSGLVRALDADETTAIFAHEVAHLEHHDRRHQLIAILSLVVLAALPLVLFAGPYAEALLPYSWVWPIAVLAAFVLKARGHRGHETESDLRGAELCGDFEALIRGLTKLHSLMRVPRRWSEQHESWSSHPSLARRVQAIRRAHAPEAESAPVESTAFFAADASRRAVVLDRARLHLLSGIDPSPDGDPLVDAAERRSLAYEELRDLRLDAAKSELVIVEREGRTSRLRLRPEEAPALSALLDRVDLKLRYASAPPSGRIATLAVALLALSTLASWTLTLIAVIAAAAPSFATLTAVAAGGIVAATLALATGATSSTLAPLALGAASLVCVGIVRARTKHELPPSERRVLLAALAPAVLACLGVGVGLLRAPSSLPWMGLHLWARDATGTIVALGALTGTLAVARRARIRWLAAPVGALLVVVVLLGRLAVGRWGGDVFAGVSSPFPETTVPLELSRTVSVPAAVSDLGLSPGGSRFYARLDLGDDYGDHDAYYDAGYGAGANVSFLVETGPGLELETKDALVLAFVDDTSLATVVRQNDRLVLELPDRDVALPDLRPIRLDVDAPSGVWQLVGVEPEGWESVVVRGELGTSAFESRQFVLSEEDDSVVGAARFDGWAVSYTYDYPQSLPWLASAGLMAAVGHVMTTELYVRHADESPERIGPSLLYPSCYDAGLPEATFLCVARHSSRTNLLVLDARAKSLEPLGWVAGDLYVGEPLRRGRFTLSSWNTSPRLVDVEEKIAYRVVLPESMESTSWGVVAWRGDTLANASELDDGSTRVDLFRLHLDRTARLH